MNNPFKFSIDYRTIRCSFKIDKIMSDPYLTLFIITFNEIVSLSMG